MLKELLDPDTWQIKPVPEEETRAPGEGHRPVGADDPVAVTGRRPSPPIPIHEPEPQRSPVLGMLEQRSPREPSAAPAGRGPAGLRRLGGAGRRGGGAPRAGRCRRRSHLRGARRRRLGRVGLGHPSLHSRAGRGRPAVPVRPRRRGRVPGGAAEPRHGGLHRARGQGQDARRRQDRVGVPAHPQRGRAARGVAGRAPPRAGQRRGGLDQGGRHRAPRLGLLLPARRPLEARDRRQARGQAGQERLDGGRPLDQPDPDRPLRRHRQAEGLGPGIALRLLRPGALRPPGQVARGLARGRPAGRARHEGPLRPRAGGQPRLHAHRSQGRPLDAGDRARWARRSSFTRSPAPGSHTRGPRVRFPPET